MLAKAWKKSPQGLHSMIVFMLTLFGVVKVAACGAENEWKCSEQEAYARKHAATSCCRRGAQKVAQKNRREHGTCVPCKKHCLRPTTPPRAFCRSLVVSKALEMYFSGAALVAVMRKPAQSHSMESDSALLSSKASIGVKQKGNWCPSMSSFSKSTLSKVVSMMERGWNAAPISTRRTLLSSERPAAYVVKTLTLRIAKPLDQYENPLHMGA